MPSAPFSYPEFLKQQGLAGSSPLPVEALCESCNAAKVGVVDARWVA
jgi:hypothetical protein